jgi:hypothetical protein
MAQDHDTPEMARQFYGHGCWAAPYWFIGPEQGMAHDENNDLKSRVEAWRDLGGVELNDCRCFQFRIGEERWHQERPQLQPTWRPLMLLLMTFLGKPSDNESLRNYQRHDWGTLSGEICVIELSGLAANSSKEDRDRESFREKRIKVIRQRMHFHKPALVVMYGLKQRQHWIAIAEHTFSPDKILKRGPTIIALTRYPTSHGSTNVYWKKLGERLRHVAQSSLPLNA